MSPESLEKSPTKSADLRGAAAGEALEELGIKGERSGSGEFSPRLSEKEFVRGITKKAGISKLKAVAPFLRVVRGNVFVFQTAQHLETREQLRKIGFKYDTVQRVYHMSAQALVTYFKMNQLPLNVYHFFLSEELYTALGISRDDLHAKSSITMGATDDEDNDMELDSLDDQILSEIERENRAKHHNSDAAAAVSPKKSPDECPKSAFPPPSDSRGKVLELALALS